MPCKRGFDFAGFDSNSPNFQLIVGATDEFDVAIAQAPHRIAGAVHKCPDAALERVCHKSFRRQLGTTQIAARYAFAADVEFSDHAHR